MIFGTKEIDYPQYGSKEIVAVYCGNKEVWKVATSSETYTRLTYIECTGV